MSWLTAPLTGVGALGSVFRTLVGEPASGLLGTIRSAGGAVNAETANFAGWSSAADADFTPRLGLETEIAGRTLDFQGFLPGFSDNSA